MTKLKSITATKTFTCDPEFYLECCEDKEIQTQEDFEEYANDSAYEVLGEGFTLTESGEEKVIPNHKVYMLWASLDLDETAEIFPDWYQDNGTPTDSGGQDMEYIETRIIQ